MNSDDFRKMMTLLETIEQKTRLQQVDEAFGIPDLPEWVPGSKANKQRKQDEEDAVKRRKKEIDEADQAWNNLKAASMSRPIWVYFFRNDSGKDPTIAKIKEAAKKGGFGTFFVEPDWEQGDPDADATGYVGSSIVNRLAMRAVPLSSIMYKGKIQGSPDNPNRTHIYTGLNWTMATSDPDSQREILDDPDNANSVAKIIDIVKRWCNWGGPPNDGGTRTTEPQKTTVAPPSQPGSNVVPLRPAVKKAA